MIVVDTSVFMAVVAREPDEEVLRLALARASRRTMSAGTYLEAAIVTEGKRLGGRTILDGWIAHWSIDVLPFDPALARLAAEAFARFGKGRHPAGLNFGDCFAYALARSLDAPLLFKGEDFPKTDIRDALREQG